MESSTMRWNWIGSKPRFGRMAFRGLAWSGTGAIALLLVANGVWVSAQAPAPGAPAAQTAAPAAVPPVSATDIVGAWQGTLHVAAAADHPEINLRIVNKITRDDKGDLKVLDYSIDQGG